MSLNQFLLQPEALLQQLDQADLALSRNPQTALDMYSAVKQHIQEAMRDERKPVEMVGMAIGAIIGFIVPITSIITVPAGIYLGNRAAKTIMNGVLTETPYYPLYIRAIEGELNAAKAMLNY
jgi:hypothetical protein